MPTLKNFAVGGDASSMNVAPAFDSYSRVTIIIDDETEISVGNDSGRELIVNCPWGTNAMALNILQSLSGYQYQPYNASNVYVDPSAELGDAVTIRGTMGGIYSMYTDFNPLMAADLSAPHEEEINHEFPYETKIERTVRRLSKDTKAEFAVQSDQISAKVSRIGGDSTSFGWNLTDTNWSLYANGQEVLKATVDGIEVTGTIKALSGYIGDGSNGFTIGSNAIYNGVTALNDTEHSGIYLGTDGIALGYGSFVVDDQGHLAATDVELTGEIHATSGTIGDGNSVFTIDGGAIRNGMTSLWDTQHDGIYLGTDGIALGRGNFRVDEAGNLTAYSGTFTGSTYASSIKSDGVNGYGGSFSGGGLADSSVAYGKTGFKSTLNQVGTNKSDIASINAKFTNSLYANIISANRITGTRIDASSSFYFKSHGISTFTYEGHHILGY